MNTLNKRGGGYIGVSSLDASIDGPYSQRRLPSNATWPFAKLIMNDGTVSLKIFHTQTIIQYAEISSVSLGKLGQMIVKAKEGRQSFAFSGLGIKDALQIFDSKQVHLDETCKSRLTYVTIFTFIQFFLQVLFVIFFLYGVWRLLA